MGTTAPAAVSSAPRALCSLRMLRKLRWLAAPPAPGRPDDEPGSRPEPVAENWSGARTGPGKGWGRELGGRTLRSWEPPLLLAIARRYLLWRTLCLRLRW